MTHLALLGLLLFCSAAWVVWQHNVVVIGAPRKGKTLATAKVKRMTGQLPEPGEQFEPWILEVDGKRRLPVFSSQEKMTVFASKMSTELNKVFSLGCIQTLLENVTKSVDVDFVDLNLFRGCYKFR